MCLREIDGSSKIYAFGPNYIQKELNVLFSLPKRKKNVND